MRTLSITGDRNEHISVHEDEGTFHISTHDGTVNSDDTVRPYIVLSQEELVNLFKELKANGYMAE